MSACSAKMHHTWREGGRRGRREGRREGGERERGERERGGERERREERGTCAFFTGVRGGEQLRGPVGLHERLLHDTWGEGRGEREEGRREGREREGGERERGEERESTCAFFAGVRGGGQ